MQQPAIQAALDNLVEVIRTALTAEFLEYFRGSDAEPARGKRSKVGAKATKAKTTRQAKTAKKKAR
jgi:ribosomal protein L4